MKSGKMLKVFSLLMVLVGVFGLFSGVWGFIDAVNTRKTQEAKRSQTEAQILQIEKETETLKAKKVEFQTDTAALIQNKASYESDKAAYDMLKTAYDAKASEFKAEKEAGHLDNASIAETQAILDTGGLKLEAGKAKLNEYEAKQTFVDNYKAEQAAVEAGLGQLSKSNSATAKIDSGKSSINAVKEAFAENTAKESRQLSSKFYLCAISMVIAVLALFAAIKGISALKSPGNDKIKDGTFLGLAGLSLAIAAAVFGVVNGHPYSIMLSSELAAETIVSLIFVIAVIKYKNAVIVRNDNL